MSESCPCAITVAQEPPAIHLPLALLCMYYHRLNRRPLPWMLLNIRFSVDSNPTSHIKTSDFLACGYSGEGLLDVKTGPFRIISIRAHPAIVLLAPLTERTKSVPNTGEYTGISD